MDTIDTFRDKFWARVDKVGECWLWLAAKDPNGYGRVGRSSKVELAHRVAYELETGDVLGTRHCMHKCDNPSCVRPTHLIAGTNYDNVQDCVRKGRQPKGEKRAHSKLTPNKVRNIREYRRKGYSYQEIGKIFSIAHTTARRVALGITWNHIS